jgi:nitroreductase
MVHFLLEQDKEYEVPGIPNGYKPFYAVALGYKAGGDPAPAPKRNMDVVTYIS